MNRTVLGLTGLVDETEGSCGVLMVQRSNRQTDGQMWTDLGPTAVFGRTDPQGPGGRVHTAAD